MSDELKKGDRIRFYGSFPIKTFFGTIQEISADGREATIDWDDKKMGPKVMGIQKLVKE